jgi:hypothetical protein
MFGCALVWRLNDRRRGGLVERDGLAAMPAIMDVKAFSRFVTVVSHTDSE